MFNWIKSNPWKSAIIAILLIYVIVSLVKKQWNPMNWFASAGLNERLVYDTARCCKAGNPCGWTKDTYSRACGA